MSNLSMGQSEYSRSDSAAELLRRLFKLNSEYSKVIGDQLQVNATDFKVMEHLIENGPSKPGEIASALGVTAGALTQSLDRLESVGHTHRERDANDRRSISVIANPDSIARAWSEIVPLIDAANETTSQMSVVENQAVVRFLGQMLAVYERQLSAAKPKN